MTLQEKFPQMLKFVAYLNKRAENGDTEVIRWMNTEAAKEISELLEFWEDNYKEVPTKENIA